MNAMTLEHYRNDPALRRHLLAAARRERARALRTGFAWLFGRIAAGVLPTRSTARWLARLG